MAGKMMKHDLTWILKYVLIFYAAAELLAVSARIFSLPETAFFSAVSSIAFTGSIILAIAGVIYTILRSWMRFIRCVYKDESYLIHTLPVSRSTVYSSLVLSGILSVLLSLAAAALVVFTLVYKQGGEEIIKLYIGQAEIMGVSKEFIVLVITAGLCFEMIFFLIIGYLGILLGHRAESGRFIKSLAFGFGIYVLCALMMLGAVWLWSLFSAPIRDIFINPEAAPGFPDVKNLILFCLGMYGAYDILGYFIGRKLMTSGINVE